MKLCNKLKQVCLIVFMSILILQFAGCSNDSNVSIPPSYPIDSTVYTTLDHTIMPIDVPDCVDCTIQPYNVADFATYGYGKWQAGAGIPFDKNLGLYPDGYTPPPFTKTATLLRFFAISDVHITDVQSPAQVLYWGLTTEGIASAYSPQILYSTQVLDAAVQTANALHQQTAFDFGIFLGDITNNAQYNELRWYIDVLDGKTINPNSDPKSTATTDYMRPFKAAGLNKSIPWYQVIGNHDRFFTGMFAQIAKTLSAYVGEDILTTGPLSDLNSLNRSDYYMGVIDGSTPYGNIIGAGKATDITPRKVDANPDRRFVSSTSWIAEFFNTTSSPVGHGFSKDNISSTCYAFEPKANLPLKVIVLDDTNKDNVEIFWGAFGYLDQARFAWLKSELQKGQNENKLMIIAAHVPVIGATYFGWDPSSSPTEAALITELHNYPNLILWISGHRHFNTVTPQPSPDPFNQPELGFWVVETASLRDFPQQFRLFDIVRNSDDTISIFTTDVDLAVRQGSPAAISRSYAIAASQIFTALKAPDYLPYRSTGGAHNAELVKPLSPAMQAIIKTYGTPAGN